MKKGCSVTMRAKGKIHLQLITVIILLFRYSSFSFISLKVYAVGVCTLSTNILKQADYMN